MRFLHLHLLFRRVGTETGKVLTGNVNEAVGDYTCPEGRFLLRRESQEADNSDISPPPPPLPASFFPKPLISEEKPTLSGNSTVLYREFNRLSREIPGKNKHFSPRFPIPHFSNGCLLGYSPFKSLSEFSRALLSFCLF